MSKCRFEKSLDKRAHVNRCASDGLIADNNEVRAALIAKLDSGEYTLEQVQSELKKIKRNAKRNGQKTRAQAFREG